MDSEEIKNRLKSIEKSSAVFKRTINRASRQKSGVDNVNKYI